MAVIKKRDTILDPVLAEELCDGIVEEMNRPNRTPRPPGNPAVIQEESGGVPKYSHWYVIWWQFAGIDTDARSRVILDAVERRFGRKEVLRTSMVMGLTPDEPLAKELFPAESTMAAAPDTAVRETRGKYVVPRSASPKRKT
jgi:hypothetical protein